MFDDSDGYENTEASRQQLSSPWALLNSSHRAPWSSIAKTVKLRSGEGATCDARHEVRSVRGVVRE